MKMSLFFLFFVGFLPSAHADLSDCREHITDAICLVDPVDYNNPFATQYNRPCLSGGEKYIPIFEEHFDESSPMIQKMYCSLEKIWVENQLTTTAYASPIYDMSNNLVSAAIGIKKEFIENPLTIDKWFSLKEEISFGSKRGLFNYKTAQSKKSFSAIHYAINHEFGHIFDYANKLNRYDEHDHPLTGSWAEISWKNSKTPNIANDFLMRLDLCFYQCGGEYVDSQKAPLLFKALESTNFPSTYATINPKEDWAETFALYLAMKEAEFTWSVDIKDQDYDLSKHFSSKQLEMKRNFVERFLNGPFIYPGQGQ